MTNFHENKGIVLLFSVLAVSIVLAIALTLLSFVIKQINITSSSRDSVNAIYAADAGIECALLWDIRGHEPGFYGGLVFASSDNPEITSGNIICSNENIRTTWGVTNPSGDKWVTKFDLDFVNSCSVLEVTKEPGGTTQGTSILSKGYNRSCATYDTDLNAVERAIKVDYIFN